MDTLSYKTVAAKSSTVVSEWLVIDAENMVVGRLAAQLAKIIRGKNKPSFSPHVNCGDKVIILNAEKVRFTGNKMNDKIYIHYTGYPGGQREITPARLMTKKPEDVLKMAVRGMLPANKLRKEYLNNLFIYVGGEHPHSAQNPKTITL
ncbi:MAG: 50S ribosomal protein L13 [Bacteroidota bacterium]|nr:50S ribosomal protein L13 [Bacteroidota bacterium]